MDGKRNLIRLIVLPLVTFITCGCSVDSITPTGMPTTALQTATPTLLPADWPRARKYGAMVWDPTTERIIMFEGHQIYEYVKGISEVWAYDPINNRWQEKGDLAPSYVRGAAVDEESQKVIVFGRGDTWAYDPAADTWQEMNPGIHPSARWGPAMAYDAESDVIVLFGGSYDIDDIFNDTWVYDFNTDTWTKMHPENSPPARDYHSMVYDPQNDRILMWLGHRGGHISEEVPDFRVWAYDYNTNTWTTQEAPTDAPGQRNGYGLFYHSPTGRMIVFGGIREDDGLLVEETTWAYDYSANSWVALTPTKNPGRRAYFLMAYAVVGKNYIRTKFRYNYNSIGDPFCFYKMIFIISVIVKYRKACTDEVFPPYRFFLPISIYFIRHKWKGKSIPRVQYIT